MSDKPIDADEILAKAKADLEAAGLPGMLNNLKGLAGVLSVVGVAAYVATPLFKEMWSAYLDKEIQGRPPLPPEAE